jgi:cardiolipin synthase
MILVLIGRDLVLGVLTILLSRRSISALSVTYLGKAATFNLMYAFPLLLLAESDGLWGDLAFVTGWSFAIWGFALYISTGVGYARQAVAQLRGSNVINSK